MPSSGSLDFVNTLPTLWETRKEKKRVMIKLRCSNPNDKFTYTELKMIIFKYNLTHHCSPWKDTWWIGRKRVLRFLWSVRVFRDEPPRTAQPRPFQSWQRKYQQLQLLYLQPVKQTTTANGNQSNYNHTLIHWKCHSPPTSLINAFYWHE